jgi:uncharacterized protein (TIGR00299 family) protein
VRTLYLECAMGASGDMLISALSALLPDRERFIAGINKALSVTGTAIEIKPLRSKGIAGLHTDVRINGVSEHSHTHKQEHSHTHFPSHSGSRDLRSIQELIDRLDIPAKVKRDSKNVYDLLAQAESKVHGTTVDLVHFHELGAMDAVCDIVCVCMIMELLSPDKTVVSPINVGSGSVITEHGTLPVPAPAAAELLKGVPIYGGDISGELCTPTGAALIKYLADEFGAMPQMRVIKTGYGIGTKEFSRCNCLRAFLGESGSENPSTNDQIVELCCNIDDMTPEALGHTAELLRQRGALDVFLIPAQTKKNRPCFLLTCLCRPQDEHRMALLILRHTSTIGLRRALTDRYTLSHRTETVNTDMGKVRVKHSEGYGILKRKPEYEDLAEIAGKTGLSIQEVHEIILKFLQHQ